MLSREDPLATLGEGLQEGRRKVRRTVWGLEGGENGREVRSTKGPGVATNADPPPWAAPSGHGSALGPSLGPSFC